jgi:hypothetical protein
MNTNQGEFVETAHAYRLLALWMCGHPEKAVALVRRPVARQSR